MCVCVYAETKGLRCNHIATVCLYYVHCACMTTKFFTYFAEQKCKNEIKKKEERTKHPIPGFLCLDGSCTIHIF